MTATETMPAMEASSLRALALSTLKSKRRKPAPAAQATVAVLTRPPPPPMPSVDSMQLDYGEDESSATIVAQSRPSLHVDTASPMTRDVLMREEGEISSDEEETVNRNLTAASPSTDSAKSTPRVVVQSLPESPTSSVRNAGLSLLDRITDAPHVLPATPESSIPLSERISSPPLPVSAPLPPRTIHKAQVRPNVSLDQAGYDAAKDHLLEVLGYGVPPEDLLGLGVSREFIYYAFTELKLRLPDNLDTTGLLPYNLDTVKDFSFIEPERSTTLRDRIQGGPPPSSAATFEAQQQLAPSPMEDLNDMEILKRKELQARKAVLATRKRKNANKAPPPTAQADVDDFLKTLTSANTASVAISSSPSLQQIDRTQPTSLSVDTTILPSTGASSTVMAPQRTTPTEAAHTEITTTEVQVNSPEITPPLPSYESAVETPAEGPPSSTESMTLTFQSAMQLAPQMGSGSTTPVTQYPPRRGVKRPVASDFVDVDTNPPADYWITSYDNTQSTQRKRPATSFVNVKQHRFVIDISDSEGEDDEDEGPPHANPTSGRGAPPNRSNAPSRVGPSSGTITPAALQEKELQILKMRERIAEMERQKLLKKLELKSASANSRDGRRSQSVVTQLPPTSPSPQTAPSPVVSPVTTQEPFSADSPEPSVTPAPEFVRSTTPARDLCSILVSRVLISYPLLFSASQEPIEVDRPDEDLATDAVDVDVEMSSSAQVEQVSEAPSDQLPSQDHKDVSTETPENPLAYQSLFALHPGLRLNSQPSLAGAWSASADSVPMSETGSSTALQLPDLQPLRERTWKKSIDPNSVLCQYEFPGGGVCRDASCEDVHLSKLNQGMEPSDHDTAKYICSAVSGLDFDSTLRVLQEETAKNPTASLEDRVARLLASRRSEHQLAT